MRALKKVSIILGILLALVGGSFGVSSLIHKTGYLETVRTALDQFIDIDVNCNGIWHREKPDEAYPEPVINTHIPVEFDYASVQPWMITYPSVEVNGNVPYFSEEEKEQVVPFISYAGLDMLGRCGSAFACLGCDLLPKEERDDSEERASVTPTGFNQKKYIGLIEYDYLYNRCHLIGWQLGGDANSQNLVTGTRFMNVYGMLRYENMVAEYLYNHPDRYVLYRVTPVFVGEELNCRGVLMEAYSLGPDFEDDGSFQFCVFAYNEQPGIEIDHSDGSNQLIAG